jgi:hypothetical protein
MSIAKIIEVKAEGSTIEAAMTNAVAEAGRSLDAIQSVYMKEAEAIVRDGEIDRFRVNTKVTFVVDPGQA